MKLSLLYKIFSSFLFSFILFNSLAFASENEIERLEKLSIKDFKYWQLTFREKRDEIRVVKKKVKVSSKLTDSDHELPREGRHLG